MSVEPGHRRTDGGSRFAVHAPSARSLTLCIFDPGADRPRAKIELDPERHRSGSWWSVDVSRLPDSFDYAWRVDDGPELLDPYASVVSGAERWRDPAAAHPSTRRRRAAVIDEVFDWGDDRRPATPLRDSVIYELHLRGFTADPSSGVARPGSFRGLIEKIPYLVELGVTAVELLPVFEFEELANPRRNPETGERLVDFWGYMPLSFFAPKAGYASRPERGAAARELKQLVKALHAAGLELILDVVFNHTGEDLEGPPVSWAGFDRTGYYLDNDFTGVGNTFRAGGQPGGRMIVDALVHWVEEYRVDGFRFDLAAVLTRDADGEALERPPLIERMLSEPRLEGIKLIAEAWDAAGLYRLGDFARWGRFAEWNGKFRDDVRRFGRGDPGTAGAMATRLTGSSDLYRDAELQAAHSINYVTCHDGFTLADLVRYAKKRNLPNGEGNRDGTPADFSDNAGVEGPTDDAEVLARRARRVRNFAVMLLLARGVPMILAGDEMGRSQNGNNNVWCQDNPLGWIDWSDLDRHADLHRFFKKLIAFRRRHELLRRGTHFPRPAQASDHVRWHGLRPGEADWTEGSTTLAMEWLGDDDGIDLLLLANTGEETVRFELPPARTPRSWRRLVDTARAAPDDIVDEGEASAVDDEVYAVGPGSVVVMVAQPA